MSLDMPAGRRAIVGSLALSIASLILALAAAELYLRATAAHIAPQGGGVTAFVDNDANQLIVYGPRGRRLKPDAHVVIRNHFLSGRDIRVDTNSHGFRDVELAQPKPADELRILVLGDSITWGMGLQVDEMFVERAEQRLRATMPTTDVQMINAGVVDIGLNEELDILEEQGLAVEPDVVVLAFYVNDSRPPWGFPEELGHRGWLRRRFLLADMIYRHLKLQRLLDTHGIHREIWVDGHERFDWRSSRSEFLELAALARYDWGAAWQPGSWAVIRAGLSRLQALSQRHRFEVAVVAFPVAHQVYARFVEDTPQQTLRAEAAALGFPYLDLLPVLRATSQHTLFFDQCHPTATGSAIIGEAIAVFLLEELSTVGSHAQRAFVP
jgi:lysophospholipase L1-like esterase